MAALQIVRGGVYANAKEVFAREVIEITIDGYVVYNDYGLSDGAPIARHRRCSLGSFSRWAARPLTPEEIANLRREEGETRETDRVRAMIELALEAAPDGLIRREFYRRGLDRVHEPDQRPKRVEESADISRVHEMTVTDRVKSHVPLLVEALAYHEAGHVVMCLVLDIPLKRAVIAEACDVQGFRGIVEVEGEPVVSSLRQALMLLASEPAEKLAPNYKKFGRLKYFGRGRRNDQTHAFNIMAPVFEQMGYAYSTALRQFRKITRPPLLGIMGHRKNQKAVREIAALLITMKGLDCGTMLAFKSKVVLPEELESSLRQS